MTIKALNSVGGFSVGENPFVVILPNGDITTTNANLTGNIFASYVLTDNYRYANGDPVDFQLPAGNTYELQFNNAGDFGASSNLLFYTSNSTLLLNGRVAANSITTTSTISSTGNVTAPFFLGNVIGNISGNIVVPGTNTSVLYNDDGSAGSSDAFQFDEVSNVLTLTGNFRVQNISNANLITSNYFNGTLVTNNQPNITSVGNLTSLTVVGNINSGNANIVSNLDVSNINSANISVTGTSNIATLIASNITYPTTDGSINQVIVTDGNGQLGFADANAHFIANGNSNVYVYNDANIAISSNGVSNVVVISSNGLFVTGETSITGNIVANNFDISGLSATGNITANQFLGNVVSAAGNITANNINVANAFQTGNLTVNAFVTSNLIPGTSNTFNLGSNGSITRQHSCFGIKCYR